MFSLLCFFILLFVLTEDITRTIQPFMLTLHRNPASSTVSCQSLYRLVLLEEFPQPFKEVHQFILAGMRQLGFDIQYLKREKCLKPDIGTLPPSNNENNEEVRNPEFYSTPDTDSTSYLCLQEDVVTITTTMCIAASSVSHWPRHPLFINLEVLEPGMKSWRRTCLDPGYRDIVWSSGPVWDYSYNNIQYIEKHGIPHQLQYLPLRYYPGLVMVTPETKYSERNDKERDTDVVFIGNWDQSPRRKKILDLLQNKGLKVDILTNAFNRTRDERVLKAKIALNVRFYLHNYETVRLFWLLSLGTFVINEADPVFNTQSMEEYKDTMVHAHYNQLVDTVLKYLPLVEERNRIADQGYRMIRSQTAGQVMYNLLKDSSIPGVPSCTLDPPSRVE